jgi:hypothetical protein
MNRSKYGARPCEIGGEKYRSQKEARRHRELVALQAAGQIAGLVREVPFVLAPAVKIEGEKRARPALRYVADFVYSTADGRLVVEDAKGMRTPVYRLKKHLMATVKNINVVES